ncbi:MAG: hypothetical protein LBJ20_03500, partial [Candidatus Methanoplasma sp.]|nr:hypothetical protein [Candidatus Methanoplasma sp.]
GGKSVTAWFFGENDVAEVTVSKGGTGNGTVSVQRDNVWHTLPYATVKVPNGILTFEAAASASSAFYMWTGDLIGTQNPKDLDIDSNMNVKAWFYANSDLVTITATKEGDGKIEYERGGTLVEFSYGTETKIPKGICSVVATAGSGSTFVWWTGDLTTLNGSENLNVIGNTSIKAWFFGDSEISDVTVGKDGDGDGDVSVRRDGVWHTLPYATVKVPNGSLTFRAMAAGGSVFVWWTGDLSGNDGQNNLEIDGNKTITAWFYLSASVTSVSTTSIGNGSGYIQFGQGGGWHDFPSALIVPKNHILSVRAVPTFGYFVEWTGAITGTNSQESFDVGVSASTVTAEFHVDGKYITTIVSGSGSISPAGSVFVELNHDQVFTVTPESGAYIIDVTVDGVPVGSIDSYTFTSVNSDHTIEVKFSPAQRSQYTVTGDAGDGVTLSPSGSNSVREGDSHTVSWTAVPGYEAKDVVIDGVSRPELAEAGSYTFLNVMSNHTISVTAKEAVIMLNIAVTGGEGYAEYSLDSILFVRYTEAQQLEPGDSIIIRAVCAGGYEFVRWDGIGYETDETISVTDIRNSITLTLVLREKSSGGGSDDDMFGSPLFILAITIILSLMLIGLLLILLSSLYKRGVDVVIINSDNSSVIGKKRARTNRPYSFTVSGEGTAAYRVGENPAWKEPVRSGNRYEIPKEDISGTLTIEVR